MRSRSGEAGVSDELINKSADCSGRGESRGRTGSKPYMENGSKEGEPGEQEEDNKQRIKK